MSLKLTWQGRYNPTSVWAFCSQDDIERWGRTPERWPQRARPGIEALSPEEEKRNLPKFLVWLSFYLDFKLLNHEVCLGQVLIGTLAVVGIESERKSGFSRPFNFLHKNRIWLGTKVFFWSCNHFTLKNRIWEEKYPWNHHRPHSLIISSRLLLLHIAIGHPRNNRRKCRSICKKKISSNKFHQTIYQSNTFPSNLEQHV